MPHTAHLRVSRRTWRLVVRATQTPLTRVLPAPHPTATCVAMGRLQIRSTAPEGATLRNCELLLSWLGSCCRAGFSFGASVRAVCLPVGAPILAIVTPFVTPLHS